MTAELSSGAIRRDDADLVRMLSTSAVLCSALAGSGRRRVF